MSARQIKLETNICTLYLTASERGLQSIYWDRGPAPFLKSEEEGSTVAKVLRKTETQLKEYFAGKRKTFELPLAVEGTEFQKKVWQQLSRIPYGTTCSYQDIAQALKNAKACRAVGTANGRNPVSIVVPCHRVIAANKTLGGYGGGLEIKRKLLALEQADVGIRLE